MNPERWRQIEELYHAARELTPADRAALLAQTDQELRLEVEAMLAQDASGKMLDRRAEEFLTDSSLPMVAVGSRLGPYQIEALLGAGGMGQVYRALDTRLNRPVAVKILSGETADRAARRRFQREAQTASSLNHPHIVTVYDAGESDSRQYLVTEFVDGGTLQDWTRAEERSWRQIVELLTGVADGLARAHEAGILHRDIKPANILVTQSGYAKLADFGLAKLATGLENAQERQDKTTRTLTEDVTAPGIVIGTLAYMSPEQAAGKPLDARSDIFSFGLVLYEALAGRRAFEGATNLEVLQKIIHGTPEPLPQDLPVALRMAVEKALEKGPADRYQSARELVVDLRKVIREPENVSTRALPYFKDRWKRAAAIGFVLLMLAAGSLLFLLPKPSQAPAALEYAQITNFTDSARAPALSPDGRMVAFIRGGEYFQSRGQIYVKLLPDGDSIQLTNEPDLKYDPVFTPDGSRVAYTLLKPGGGPGTPGRSRYSEVHRRGSCPTLLVLAGLPIKGFCFPKS